MQYAAQFQNKISSPEPTAMRSSNSCKNMLCYCK